MRLAGSFILMVLFFMTGFSSAQDNQIVIVAFGNSVTAPRKGVEKVYSVRIREKLEKSGITCRVVNSGVGSSHTGSIKDNDFAKVRHGMDRFQQDVLDHCPDWVIINFGLNDAYQDKGIGSEPRIPIDSYRKNLIYFINEIRKQGGRVILLTPNPLGSKYEPFRLHQVEKYADCLREVAAEQQTELVDSWSLFHHCADSRGTPGNLDFLFLDGIHPNDQGHELMAEAIFKILNQNLITNDN